MKLALRPDRKGYRAHDQAQVVAIELDGGARYRQDLIGAGSRVKVAWTTDPKGYAYLRALHRLTGAKGAPLEAGLILDRAAVETYQAHFVPGSFALAEKDGLRFRVQGELEVDAAPQSDADLEAVLRTYETGLVVIEVSEPIALGETLVDSGTTHATEAVAETLAVGETTRTTAAAAAPVAETLAVGETTQSTLAAAETGKTEALPVTETTTDGGGLDEDLDSPFDG